MKNAKRKRMVLGGDGESRPDLPYIAADFFDRGLNGYLNYGRFAVSDGHTVRKYDARDADAAKKAAEEDGMTGTLRVTAQPHEAPASEQLEYARDLGVTMPPDVCREDVACLISRTADGDTTVPSVGLARYADRHGAHFSAWIGCRDFYNLLWQTLDTENRLKFFLYCVKCYLYSIPAGDPDTDDVSGQERFAAEYADNEEVLRVLAHTEGESLLTFDAYSARTNTVAFTAAVNFLRGYRLA